MELFYLWVEEYKNIKNQGFNFSPRFDCEYNGENLTIKETRNDELYKDFYKKLGYTKEDVKNMIFCNYLHKDNINKRNHSKLTQDILKQFELKE